MSCWNCWNELLKSIETVGEIIGGKILYINTGIFMRSVDLFSAYELDVLTFGVVENLGFLGFGAIGPTGRKFVD